MAFGTLNSILSTTVSITYTCCCAIVLMLHNGSHIPEGGDYKALNYQIKTNV